MIGKGLSRAITLNDNAINYVHWDDPNELVDHAIASRQTGRMTTRCCQSSRNFVRLVLLL